MRFPFDEAGLERFAKAIDKGARAWEKIFEDKAKVLFRQERDLILGLLQKYAVETKAANFDQFLLEAEAVWDEAGERWREAFLPVFQGYMAAQGETIAATFGISFDIKNPRVIRFLQNYTMKFADGIVGKSGLEVRDIITLGQKEGWSIPQMRKALQAEFSEFDRVRATRIARTETIRSSNAAALESYRQAGLARFEWYTGGIDPCDFCKKLQADYGPGTGGQIIGEVFFEQGESLELVEERLIFNYEAVYHPPLHPNCRCTVLPVVEPIVEGLREIGAEFIVHEGISSQFEGKVEGYYERVPRTVRDALAERDVTVHLHPGVATDHYPHLKKAVPRGWGRRASWDDVEGFWDPSSGRVAMFEQGCKFATDRRIEEVLYHEIGHAIDDLSGPAVWVHRELWDGIASVWSKEVNPYFKNPDEAFAQSVMFVIRDGGISHTTLPHAVEVERYFRGVFGPEAIFPLIG